MLILEKAWDLLLFPIERIKETWDYLNASDMEIEMELGPSDPSQSPQSQSPTPEPKQSDLQVLCMRVETIRRRLKLLRNVYGVKNGEVTCQMLLKDEYAMKKHFEKAGE